MKHSPGLSARRSSPFPTPSTIATKKNKFLLSTMPWTKAPGVTKLVWSVILFSALYKNSMTFMPDSKVVKTISPTDISGLKVGKANIMNNG